MRRFQRADQLIYESALERADKADMLTSMAILSGLVSDELPLELVARRRDLMIESAAYDIIKQAGRQAGLEQGICQGVLNAIAFGLDLRFGAAGLRLLSEIHKIEDVGLLRAIQQRLRTAQTPTELREIYRE